MSIKKHDFKDCLNLIITCHSRIATIIAVSALYILPASFLVCSFVLNRLVKIRFSFGRVSWVKSRASWVKSRA